ncbi:MAG: GGDEF domain-containing protein [Microcoleus sp.]
MTAILDYFSGSEIRFDLVYLIPILLSATINRRFGIIIAIFSALVSISVDLYLHRFHSNNIYYVWDLISRAAIFSLLALLRSSLIDSRQKESELARTDPLTGAMNLRAFKEQLESEIYRASRYCYPLTIAYIDIDNFKTINDTLGHSEGNRVLCAVVTAIKKHSRKSDTVARLGGDEFAILLPVTDREDSHKTINTIQGHMMDEVRKNRWNVTFSIGVLTCIEIPSDGDKMIEAADNLMYMVKQQGKNSINYSLYNHEA